MSDLKPVRAQGAAAKALNESGEAVIRQEDCPYGPGENRDAWIAGFGGVAETVEQVDTSTPSDDTVRYEVAETVKEPKGKKTKASAKDAKTVRTDTSGTAETSLKTVATATNPELADTVPVPEVVVGDPAASTSPAETSTPVDSDGEKLM